MQGVRIALERAGKGQKPSKTRALAVNCRACLQDMSTMAEQRNKVRIIGGAWRRRLLPFPDAQGLRPTPDRVRETLFNWLGQELDGQDCLDLFAGSGALGFEAASRGARRVLMVEKNRTAAQSLDANRRTLEAANVEVRQADALMMLAGLPERFDLIFLDPPFDLDLLPQLLPKALPLLKDGGYIYIEGRTLPDCEGLVRVREGKAGVVRYALLEKV